MAQVKQKYKRISKCSLKVNFPKLLLLYTLFHFHMMCLFYFLIYKKFFNTFDLKQNTHFLSAPLTQSDISKLLEAYILLE